MDWQHWRAYCLDSAIILFGHTVEIAVNNVKDDNPKRLERKQMEKFEALVYGRERQFRPPPRPAPGQTTVTV